MKCGMCGSVLDCNIHSVQKIILFVFLVISVLRVIFFFFCMTESCTIIYLSSARDFPFLFFFVVFCTYSSMLMIP